MTEAQEGLASARTEQEQAQREAEVTRLKLKKVLNNALEDFDRAIKLDENNFVAYDLDPPGISDD